MNITIEYDGGMESVLTNDNESDFYEAVAKVITKLTPPNTVNIYTDLENFNKAELSEEYIEKLKNEYKITA